MLAEFSLNSAFGLYNYWIVIFLMMTGFYLVIARGNLIKTIIGLNIFQTSVVLFYVTMGKVAGGKGAPIMPPGEGHGHGHEHDLEQGAHGLLEHPPSGRVGEAGEGELLSGEVFPVSFEESHAVPVSHATDAIDLYSNPLPSVLMLTAIVVGVATMALALALTVRIREEYGTIEEDEILELDQAQ